MTNRRIGIILLIIAILSAVLNGCYEGDAGTQVNRSSSDEPADPRNKLTHSTKTGAAVAQFGGYKQSPFLDGRDLPPVEERLPKEPKLTNELPADYLDLEIGTYGGTLRTVRMNPTTDAALWIIQNEPLVNTPGLIGEEVTPNIVRSFEVSGDQKQFTFTLREGLKWSDGVPVTTEDVRFAVEDVLFNEELTPIFPLWLKSAADASGTPLQFEVIDDYTFRISFDKPYGGFLLQLAWQGWRGYTDLIKPKHYLAKYHKKYADPEELAKLLKEAGLRDGDWAQLFIATDVLNNEATMPKALGFPVLSPYVLTKSGDVIEFERNPYYFKVDAAGNQLPYIDKLKSTLVQNSEMVILKILAGEVDHSYEFLSIPNVPLLKEKESEGGYKIYLNTLHRTANDIHLNLTYQDEAWRQVVRDVRFRKALDLALDKKEIADTVFYGFANPSPIQNTERDLDEANRLLDEMGLKRDAAGYRLGPDGKRIEIPFEVSSQFSDFAILGELVVEQWKQLGLDVSLKQIDATLYDTRNKANELKATIMFTPGPVQWVREQWGQNIWAPLWDQWWNSGGRQGEEPPQEALELFRAIASLRELSHEEALRKREEIRRNIGENYWYFIHSENIAAPVAINAKLANVSETGWGISHNFAAEQWFFKD
jgi:peptide/nickel transport system substrate-binding protein